jgi:hypothetical protein
LKFKEMYDNLTKNWSKPKVLEAFPFISIYSVKNELLHCNLKFLPCYKLTNLYSSQYLESVFIPTRYRKCRHL